MCNKHLIYCVLRMDADMHPWHQRVKNHWHGIHLTLPASLPTFIVVLKMEKLFVESMNITKWAKTKY